MASYVCRRAKSPLNACTVAPKNLDMDRQATRSSIRAVFARVEDPYAGGDIETACRLGAALWLFATAVTVLLLPLSPPDAAIGDGGWAVAGVVVLAGVAGARYMRRHTLPWDVLLAASYLSIAQVAALGWLAGGGATPYEELYLLVALYAGGMHPPRRLAGVLGAIMVANIVPLVAESAASARIGQVAMRLVLLSAVAFIASMLMRTVRAQRIGLRDRGDRAERLARVDELTELPNRRAFGEALAHGITRARRFGTPLSLVVADLDGFKQINDEHGHQVGDACLQSIARMLERSLRQYDECFRWGGDEFALLLPETTADEAEAVFRRVAGAILAGCRTPAGTGLRITGAAAQLEGHMTGDDLVAAADAALLERKGGPRLRLAESA